MSPSTLLNKNFHSKTLICVFLSNISWVILANLLELKTISIVFFYPIFLIMYAKLIFTKSSTKRSSFSFDTKVIYLAFFFLLLINLPRLSYVAEWVLPGSVELLVDDTWRIGQLMSMTLSEKFPLQFYLNQNYLFSYYYCSLIPMAFIKLLIPVVTLKDTLFLGYLFYTYFVVFSFAEVARFMFKTKTQAYCMLFLLTFCCGFDWVVLESVEFMRGNSIFQNIINHYEWWHEYFNGNTQITSYPVALFATITNFLGFYAVILSYAIGKYFNFKDERIKVFIVIGLLISSFYTSVFSFLPVILFLFIERAVILNRIRRNILLVLALVILALVPLYLFLGKLGSEKFIYSTFRVLFTENFFWDKVLSFSIYLILVPLVDISGIPLILLFKYKKFNQKDKAYYLAASFYFLLTYIIAYGKPLSVGHSFSNNFAMRGMFLPMFVFYYLFCKYWATSIIAKLTTWSCGLESRPNLVLSFKLISSVIGIILIWMVFNYDWMGREGLSRSGQLNVQIIFALVGLFLQVGILNIKIVPKGWFLVLVIALMTSLGTFKELGSLWSVSVHSIRNNLMIETGSLEYDTRRLARDNTIKYYPYEVTTHWAMKERHAEKFIQNIAVEDMANADSQTLKFPRKYWFK